jgi:hypothetical protein
MDEWQAEIDKQLEAEVANYAPKRPWTPAEDAVLAKYYGRVPTRRIAEILGRSINGTYERASRIGITVGY